MTEQPKKQVSTSPKSFNKWIDLLVVVIVVWAIPVLASIFADAVFPFVSGFDPDNTFLWITIHHLGQLLLTILVMLWFYPRLAGWGLNVKNLSTSLQWIAIFLLLFGAIEIYSKWDGYSGEFGYPLTLRNTLGVHFFQYVMSGWGEEPLFRGFVMTFLAPQWRTTYRLFGLDIPQTVLIATALFMLAHVTIDPFNLSISGFDFGQQMKALQLGLLYGVAFHYTKSLVAPIVIHGISNGLQWTLFY